MKIEIKVHGSYPIIFTTGVTTGGADNGIGFDTYYERNGRLAGGVISRGDAWKIILLILPHLLFSHWHIFNKIWYGDSLKLFASISQGGLRNKLVKLGLLKKLEDK